MNIYKRGAKGEYIVDLQRRLIAAGYALPRFGADGDFGEEVVHALMSWGIHFGALHRDHSTDPTDFELQQLATMFLLHDENSKIRIDNDRLVRLDPKFGGKHVRGKRHFAQIDSIVLHQTGCVFKYPSGSCAIWHNVPIHVGVPRSRNELGKFIKVNELQDLLWHAQGLSRRSIGIEIEGNFPGLAGNRKTWWSKGGGPHKLLPEQVEAARAAIDWIIESVNAASPEPIKYIFAHRQASINRIADPGEEIWKTVGLWAIEKYNLWTGDTKTWSTGNGYSLPDEWTGEENGVGYYE